MHEVTLCPTPSVDLVPCTPCERLHPLVHPAAAMGPSLAQLLADLRASLAAPPTDLEPQVDDKFGEDAAQIKCVGWGGLGPRKRGQVPWPTPTWRARCREEEDLKSGAVLQAVLHPGEGEAMPQDGDLVRRAPAEAGAAGRGGAGRAGRTQPSRMHPGRAQVYLQYSIADRQENVLFTTLAQHGGSGLPQACVLGQGHVVRGVEVAVRGEPQPAGPPGPAASHARARPLPDPDTRQAGPMGCCRRAQECTRTSGRCSTSSRRWPTSRRTASSFHPLGCRRLNP